MNLLKCVYCDLTFEKLFEIVDHTIIALPTEVLKIKCYRKLRIICVNLNVSREWSLKTLEKEACLFLVMKKVVVVMVHGP